MINLQQDRQLDNYQLIDGLGSGGFSHVHLVRDKKNNKTFALKTLRPELNFPAGINIFQNNCSIAEKLSGKGPFPKFIAAGESDWAGPNYFTPRGPYLLMEYIKGVDLDSYCKCYSSNNPEWNLRIMHGCAKAYETMHQEKIVHVDVKPRNIIINDKGKPIICDFDLSFEGDWKEVKNRNVLVNPEGKKSRGTLKYQAPETIELDRGEGHTQYSDVWGLGAAFYHLLTGELPFKARTTDMMIRIICGKEPEPLTQQGIDSKVAEVVHSCLEKKWWKRPDATEVVARLDEII
jgi:eukaryotic-like serine/threonine-protein kinase